MSLKAWKVYYAHPMSWYGTPDEEADMVTLLGMFGEVVNPNHPSFQDQVDACYAAGNGAQVMEIFRASVRECDAVAVRPFKDGRISAGVAAEALEARVWGKGLFTLPCVGRGGFKLSQVLTIEETRARIRKGDL